MPELEVPPVLDVPVLVVVPVPDEVVEPCVEVDPCVDVEPELEELAFALPVAVVDVLDPWFELDPELAELAFDPLPEFELELELLPLDCDPELFIARIVCHQLSVELLAVLLETGVVELVPAGVTEVGLVLAAVFEALVVLAVPPLTLG